LQDAHLVDRAKLLRQRGSPFEAKLWTEISRSQLGGFKSTIRFTNAEVGKNVEGVLTRILSELGALPDRWPHPNPSPEREGK